MLASGTVGLAVLLLLSGARSDSENITTDTGVAIAIGSRSGSPTAVQVLQDQDVLNETNEAENDGMIGVVPELFYEDDDSQMEWPIHDSIKALLALCKTATKCEDCPATATNSKMLIKYQNVNPPCDVLSHYNYEKLRTAQKSVKKKREFVYSYHSAVIYAVCYGLLILMGMYLLAVRQFRFDTLWDASAKDPTQGMRSFRYERMEFTFDPADPGAEPDDLKGYEDWEVYDSDDEEGAGKGKSTGGGSATKDRTTTADGPRIWPWELPGYDFSTIPYKHGTKKDMEDWRPDDDSVA